MYTKPRYRFKERVGGTYTWEPVDDRDPTLTSTVYRYWEGQHTAAEVSDRARDRAAELHLTPRGYSRWVQTLRDMAHHPLAELLKGLPTTPFEWTTLKRKTDNE